MGEAYTSPCGCTIAERVRPRRRGQWGQLIHRGMAMLHVQFKRRKMTMGLGMFPGSAHTTWHVSQIDV